MMPIFVGTQEATTGFQSPIPPNWTATHSGLFALSRRISDNRVIAGVHFDIDCEAGFLLAKEIDRMMGALPASSEFKSLIAVVKKEFPQFA